MTLIKKRDVKSYFAAKGTRARQLHIVRPSQPDATGFPGNEPAVTGTSAADFDKDFTADHSSSGKPEPPPGDSKACPDPRTSAKLGRMRP